jgi:hypothetical protein
VVLGASATLAGFLVLVRDGQESLAMMLIRGGGLLLMVVGLSRSGPWSPVGVGACSLSPRRSRLGMGGFGRPLPRRPVIEEIP